MARKPNYSFERNARAKTKLAKKQAKRHAKSVARAKKAGKPIPDMKNTNTQPQPTTTFGSIVKDDSGSSDR